VRNFPDPAPGCNAIDAPSGKVPGGDDGAWSWRSQIGGGDEGLDRVSAVFFRVLVVIL
jgi:hypothetical protein